MKIFTEQNEIVITEIPFIPVDNSPFGKSRAANDCETMPDIEALVIAAKEHGFSLPGKAFIHCFESWALDFKSNYHHNGINVFTPCGCNKLRFTIYRSEGETYYA